MTTLFQVEYHKKGELGIIHNIVREENSWVFLEDGVIPTRKFDGTAVLIKNGVMYKRYDAKRGKSAPVGAIPCQEPDLISGHHPHWVMCDINNPQDKYFFEALIDRPNQPEDGTYELCGPKVGNNAEKCDRHVLFKHGSIKIDIPDMSFYGIKEVLYDLDIEGIVFHGKDEKICKIRKSDFGFTR